MLHRGVINLSLMMAASLRKQVKCKTSEKLMKVKILWQFCRFVVYMRTFTSHFVTLYWRRPRNKLAIYATLDPFTIIMIMIMIMGTVS